MVPLFILGIGSCLINLGMWIRYRQQVSLIAIGVSLFGMVYLYPSL